MRERLKTVLIWLLIALTLFMAARTWAYDGRMLQNTAIAESRLLSSIFGVPYSRADLKLAPAIWEFSQAVRPARCAVMSGGLRTGAGQGSPAVDEMYDALSVYIGEALATAGVPVRMDEKQWESALGETGVYFEYLSGVRLDVLGVWLSVESKLDGFAARFALVQAGNGCDFLYEDGGGTLWRAPTEVRQQTWLVPDGMEPCLFVFESENQPPFLSRRELILRTGRVMGLQAEARAVIPTAEPLLRALDFSPSTSFYTLDEDGSRVYVDGLRFCRISSGGEIFYKNPADAEPGGHLYLPDAENVMAGRIEHARRLGAMLFPALGEGVFWLWSAEETDGGTEVTFLATAGGIPAAGGMAAYLTVVIENNTVRSLSARLRFYSLDEQASIIPMPVEMAAALLTRPENGLILCYPDETDGVHHAVWGRRASITLSAE